jgi:signal peptidase II
MTLQTSNIDKQEKKIYPFFILSVILVIFDQLTKLLIHGFSLFGINFQGLKYGELINLFGSYVQITYIENPGMAFGIHFGLVGKFFLSSFSVVASIVLIYIIRKLKENHFAVKLAFSLILAGAFGNLIDRVFYGVIFGYAPLLYGKVVDFIQVDIPDINIGNIYMTHFPVFNVADSCVTVGIVILLLFFNKIPPLSHFFKKKNHIEEENDATLKENSTTND